MGSIIGNIEQEVKDELVKVGHTITVMGHTLLGECVVLEKTVQGFLIESIHLGEKMWIPEHWAQEVEAEKNLSVREFFGLDTAPVTVPEQVQTPATGTDPATGLWIPPAPAPDAGAL